MKPEYDFSKGERGKFFRPNAELRLPIYLTRRRSELFDRTRRPEGYDTWRAGEYASEARDSDDRIREVDLLALLFPASLGASRWVQRCERTCSPTALVNSPSAETCRRRPSIAPSRTWSNCDHRSGRDIRCGCARVGQREEAPSRPGPLRPTVDTPDRPISHPPRFQASQRLRPGETLPALLRFHEAPLHRLRLQQVGRFPLGSDSRHNEIGTTRQSARRSYRKRIPATSRLHRSYTANFLERRILRNTCRIVTTQDRRRMTNNHLRTPGMHWQSEHIASRSAR